MNIDSIVLPTTIDEKVKFAPLPASFGNKIVIDCGKNKFINSLGIRELMSFLKKIPEETIIEFKDCRTSMVRTMNMVAGLTRMNSVIQSFYLPLYCETCDREIEVLLVNQKDYEFKLRLPNIEKYNCDTCKEELSPAVLLQTYFKFISS